VKSVKEVTIGRCGSVVTMSNLAKEHLEVRHVIGTGVFFA
jgi:hypothetical protein